MSATVTVSGTAVVNAQPDEVTLDLTVSYLDRSAEAALAEVTRRSGQLEAIFDALGIDAKRRTTTGATVREETEWNDTMRQHVHRGYMATNRVHLRLDDPTPLGRLLNEAVSSAEAEVSGPTWSVADHNPARIESCRLAALNARDRAEAYATALGVRLGAIVSIAEPGTTPEPMLRRDSFAAPRAMAMAASPPEVEIHAGEMEVRATVQITFAIEQG